MKLPKIPDVFWSLMFLGYGLYGVLRWDSKVVVATAGATIGISIVLLMFDFIDWRMDRHDRSA